MILYEDSSRSNFFILNQIISEVICFESQLIDSVSENNPQALSESYAARGETLLLNNQISEALNDFCMSYYYASQVRDEYISPDLLFRSLFGQALAYAYLGEASPRLQDLGASSKEGVLYQNTNTKEH